MAYGANAKSLAMVLWHGHEHGLVVRMTILFKSMKSIISAYGASILAHCGPPCGEVTTLDRGGFDHAHGCPPSGEVIPLSYEVRTTCPCWQYQVVIVASTCLCGSKPILHGSW